MIAEIIDLLDSKEWVCIEDSVAEAAGLKVYRDRSAYSVIAVAKILERELAAASLTVLEAKEVVLADIDYFSRFVTSWLNSEYAKDDSQEYPKYEPPEKYLDDPKPVEHGLSEGFALGYAGMYRFLSSGDTGGLIAYCKAIRVPHARLFAQKIQNVYVHSQNNRPRGR